MHAATLPIITHVLPMPPLQGTPEGHHVYAALLYNLTFHSLLIIPILSIHHHSSLQACMPSE